MVTLVVMVVADVKIKVIASITMAVTQVRALRM